MGEKKYTLEEYVFRDIRIIDDSKKEYQIKTKEAINLFHQYKNRVKIYRFVMGEFFSAYPDAERWDIAFESYTKKYKCLKNGYKERNGFLWYEQNGTKTKITADVLTGPIEIIRIAEKFKKLDKQKKKELLSTLDLFCSVAYTVGNCCPVMKNPKTEGDFCWSKLASFHNTERGEKLTGINEANWDNDLRKREALNMFAVFPGKLSGREIVNNLMLNDYYDSDYKLNINYTLEQCNKMNADDYIKFMKYITKLIVKRGIRIYKQNDLRGININKMAVKLINEKIRREGWKMEFECK